MSQTNPDHYQTKIQPIDYIEANKLGFSEGNVIKYVTRHRGKNGRDDIVKALRYLTFILNEYDGYPITLDRDGLDVVVMPPKPIMQQKTIALDAQRYISE